MRQVNDHSREEAGFCESQEKACRVELPDRAHEASENRDYTPRYHDPRNPFPRAPAFDDDGSRYLEQNVSQVKHAYSQAVHSIAEA